MKLLCDVHIPYRLVKWLENQDVEAMHVNHLPDKWHTSDVNICRYADINDYVVVSKDADFRNSHFLHHTPRKLIRIALGNLSNEALITLFAQYLVLFQEYFAHGDGYIELHPNQITLYPQESSA
jgi:predicted nuclease of predicted toxin-antitoxin system